MLEYLLVFGAFPALLSAYKPHAMIYPLMWCLAALAIFYMRRHHGYRFYDDWNVAALTKAFWKRTLPRFLPFAVALFIFTALVVPDHLLNLPRHRLQMWVGLMIFYPLSLACRRKYYCAAISSAALASSSRQSAA